MKNRPEIKALNLTSNDIVSRYIKPETNRFKCSYSELLAANEGDAAVSRGSEFFFCSHTWGTPFSDMVDQLMTHFSPENQSLWRPKGSKILEQSEVYLFVDILVMNQHRPEDVEFGALLVTLKETVEDATDILMILDPSGIILTRIWCLYEAWHAGRKTGKGQSTSFLKLLAYGLEWKNLQQVFIDLDVSRAKASAKHDLDAILADIVADVGVQKMTHQLKDALVNSIVSSVPPDDEEHPWNEKLGYTIYKAASMCDLYGRLSDAEPFYRRHLHGHQQTLGPDHPDTLASVNNLALSLQNQGKLSEAEPIYKITLETTIKVLGPDHPATLNVMLNLASLLQDQGKLTEAEPLCRAVFENRVKVFGPDHPDTLSSTNNLASLLQDQGKLSDAEPLYRTVLEARMKLLGPDHPDTLTSMGNLALLLHVQGKFSEAEPLYRSTFESRVQVSGPDHPHTLASMNNLAQFLHNQGNTSEAEPLFIRTLEGVTRALGPDHPNTLASMSQLADLYQIQGRLDESVSLQLSALEGRRKVLGADHPHTMISLHSLAAVYFAKGMVDEARPLCICAMQERSKILGPDHQDTLDSVRLLEEINDCEESK